MLTKVLITLGYSRDDKKWFWMQLVALAGLIVNGVVNVPYWAAYLHIPLSDVGLHWVLFVAGGIAWLGGRYNTSPLPSAKAMESGTVPGSPTNVQQISGASKP